MRGGACCRRRIGVSMVETCLEAFRRPFSCIDVWYDDAVLAYPRVPSIEQCADQAIGKTKRSTSGDAICHIDASWTMLSLLQSVRAVPAVLARASFTYSSCAMPACPCAREHDNGRVIDVVSHGREWSGRFVW
jgi:hypothetical protein